MHKDFQLHNPFRLPQWRYDRVIQLVEHQPRPLPASAQRDDEFVRKYRTFVIRYRNMHTEEGRHSLFPDQPELYYAHLIHHNPDTEWRALVQARILTQVDDVEIASKTNTLPGAIDWYEKLFFNVRDRLHSHDWLVKSVLGTGQARAANREGSMTDFQRDMLYKLFGYFGGPLVLDVIISGFVSGDIPKRSKDIGGWFNRTMTTLIKRKSTLAAHVFETNKYNVMELFQVHLAITGQEKLSGGGSKSDMEQALETMLQGIPWGLARQDTKGLTSQQQEFATGHIEPRADDQLFLASGEIPDTLKKRVANTNLKLIEMTVEGEG